ncbi:hypothetical protein T06_8736 [Trichinella sp. T6]|nr:hypothetical protein T06_8736 [Trichinella sp. T6]
MLKWTLLIKRCLAWSKVSFAIAFCAFCVVIKETTAVRLCFSVCIIFILKWISDTWPHLFFRPKQQRTAESFTCASVIHLALLVTAFDIVIAGRRANVKSNRSLLRTSRISEADGSAWTYGSSYATYRSSSAGFQ